MNITHTERNNLRVNMLTGSPCVESVKPTDEIMGDNQFDSLFYKKLGSKIRLGSLRGIVSTILYNVA